MPPKNAPGPWGAWSASRSMKPRAKPSRWWPPARAGLMAASCSRRACSSTALSTRIELQYADAGRDVEAFDALDAHGLQDDGFIAAADQGVGAHPIDGGHAAGDAAIVTGQRARTDVAGRRNHAPQHDAVLAIADIDAVFFDRAAVAIDAALDRKSVV